MAKALSSVGKTKEKCGRDEEAGEHYAEAVAVFRKTTGRGPLLAGSLALLGKGMLRRNQFMAAGNALVRDKLPPSTSFFCELENTDGVHQPPSKGVGAPHQCPLGSVASYLCHFMLTCGCTFR